jgi:negative regulator of genetic competence, sporulation and motility
MDGKMEKELNFVHFIFHFPDFSSLAFLRRKTRNLEDEKTHTFYSWKGKKYKT